jgi:hypothetical protein
VAYAALRTLTTYAGRAPTSTTSGSPKKGKGLARSISLGAKGAA